MFRPEEAAARTRNLADDRIEERLLCQLMDLLAVEHHEQVPSNNDWSAMRIYLHFLRPIEPS
eukprot:1892543-Pyramimonas_sp.AAC.1